MKNEALLDEIKRLPSFGSGAVGMDEADSAIASVKMTVGDIRTIRRLRAFVDVQITEEDDT